MREEVIDSSVLLAFWIKEDEFHSQAVEVMKGLRTGEKKFHIPTLVVVEVCGAIRRRVGEEEARKRWELLQSWIKLGSVKLYPLDEGRMAKAIEKAIGHRLRGADAVVVQLADELQLPLHTFDQ